MSDSAPHDPPFHAEHIGSLYHLKRRIEVATDMWGYRPAHVS